MEHAWLMLTVAEWTTFNSIEWIQEETPNPEVVHLSVVLSIPLNGFRSTQTLNNRRIRYCLSIPLNGFVGWFVVVLVGVRDG